MTYPCSPNTEIDGLPYLPRLIEKIRLHHRGELHPELHDNLGKGMDHWTCQYLGVTYQDLKQTVLSGASDAETLRWARQNGTTRSPEETQWWIAYMRTRGYRDDLSEKLALRKKEHPRTDRADIQTFFDYLDADENRA
ncbi:MAG: DUF5069 domain-containing protein [Verrucomicrobiales bacterium]